MTAPKRPAKYGRPNGEFATMSDEERSPIVQAICEHVSQGDSPEVSCWLEQVDPDEFKALSEIDDRVYRHFMHYRAKGERNLRKTLAAGGKGMSEAKAALEILERQFKGWERKATQNLPKQLEEVLERLQGQLCEGKQFAGPEAYEVVVRELAKG